MNKKIWEYCRVVRNFFKKKKLKNSDMSVFCNNCVGAMVCHDLGLRFNSPTVNLWMTPHDYIEFLRIVIVERKEYRIEEVDSPILPNTYKIGDDRTCPKGLLNGVCKIYFKHYPTFIDAIQKWNSRFARINLDNSFFILIERDGCTYNDLKQFDSLPLDNKLMIVHKDYPEFKSCWTCPESDTLQEVPDLTRKVSWHGKRGYDIFDWVNWFNTSIKYN